VVSLVFVWSCALTQNAVKPLHTPPTAEQLQLEQDDAALKASRLAHAAVDEANVLLNVVNNRIREKADLRSMPKKRLEELLNKTAPYEQKLDDARKALALGNFSDAKIQAELLTQLIRQLQIELAN
jgi:hypothetical protein